MTRTDRYMSKRSVTRVVVDSANRDRTKYPNAGKFRVTLTDPINNVRSIKLVNSVVPNTQNVINSYFNKISIVWKGVTYNLEIPVGDYSYVSAKNVISQIITNSINDPDLNLVISEISNTGKYRIHNSQVNANQFQFLVRSGIYADNIQNECYVQNNIGKNLGLTVDTTSAENVDTGGGVLLEPNLPVGVQYILSDSKTYWTGERYVTLGINTNSSNPVSRCISNLNYNFAFVLMFTTLTNSFNITNNDLAVSRSGFSSYDRNYYEVNDSESGFELRYMDIDIRNYAGREYLFENNDILLEFEVEHA